MNNNLNENIIDSIFGSEDSGLANPEATNPEEIKKDLEDAAKSALGTDNVDVSKCSSEELLGLIKNATHVEECLSIIADNLDSFDESVITAALMDRYGFLDDEASNIYESIRKKCMPIDELYDALDKASIKGYIPNKYIFDKCLDDCFVPESLEDCIDRYGSSEPVKGTL